MKKETELSAKNERRSDYKALQFGHEQSKAHTGSTSHVMEAFIKYRKAQSPRRGKTPTVLGKPKRRTKQVYLPTDLGGSLVTLNFTKLGEHLHIVSFLHKPFSDFHFADSFSNVSKPERNHCIMPAQAKRLLY